MEVKLTEPVILSSVAKHTTMQTARNRGHLLRILSECWEKLTDWLALIVTFRTNHYQDIMATGAILPALKAAFPALAA